MRCPHTSIHSACPRRTVRPGTCHGYRPRVSPSGSSSERRAWVSCLLRARGACRWRACFQHGLEGPGSAPPACDGANGLSLRFQGPPGPQGPIGYPGPRGVKVRLAAVLFPAVSTGLRGPARPACGIPPWSSLSPSRTPPRVCGASGPRQGAWGGTSPSHEGLTQRRGPSPVRL